MNNISTMQTINEKTFTILKSLQDVETLMVRKGNGLFNNRKIFIEDKENNIILLVEFSHTNIRVPSCGKIKISFEEFLSNLPIRDRLRVRSFTVPHSTDCDDVLEAKAVKFATKLLSDVKEAQLQARVAAELRESKKNDRVNAITDGISSVAGVTYDEKNDKILYRGVELNLSSWQNGLTFSVNASCNSWNSKSVDLETVTKVIDLITQ